MKTHSLFSQNKDMPVQWFPKFDKEPIRQAIINLLTEDPKDTIELCREYPKDSYKRFYGSEIISFYEVNPKTGQPSKVILKGDKQYYTPLSEVPLPF